MQILNYRWEKWKPVFTISNGNGLEKLQLLNRDLDFTVQEKTCTGYSKNGKHFECKNSINTREWKCNSCMLNDHFFMCIKCTGKECINESRRKDCKKENYFIYLSAFDSILKVGISQGYRLLERLVEQGADFGAKVAQVTDGKLVRKIEQNISSYLGITDRVSGIEKQKKLFGDPNISIRNIFNAVSKLRNNGFNEHLVPIEIYDLREYYNMSNIYENPEPLEVGTGTKIEGTVKAAKGNILILKDEFGFRSFNVHDLIGRNVIDEYN
jgi:hypothetical protein